MEGSFKQITSKHGIKCVLFFLPFQNPTIKAYERMEITIIDNQILKSQKRVHILITI